MNLRDSMNSALPTLSWKSYLSKPTRVLADSKNKCFCLFHKQGDVHFEILYIYFTGFMDYVSVACPNLIELHLGQKNGKSGSKFGSAADFFSGINFQHLQFLTINGMYLFDGSYLPMVMLKYQVDKFTWLITILSLLDFSKLPESGAASFGRYNQSHHSFPPPF